MNPVGINPGGVYKVFCVKNSPVFHGNGVTVFLQRDRCDLVIEIMIGAVFYSGFNKSDTELPWIDDSACGCEKAAPDFRIQVRFQFKSFSTGQDF